MCIYLCFLLSFYLSRRCSYKRDSNRYRILRFITIYMKCIVIYVPLRLDRKLLNIDYYFSFGSTSSRYQDIYIEICLILYVVINVNVIVFFFVGINVIYFFRTCIFQTDLNFRLYLFYFLWSFCCIFENVIRSYELIYIFCVQKETLR